MKKFKLTASMPCFGHIDETKRMIEQIARQSLSGCEIYIVGDACAEFQKLIDSGYMNWMANCAALHGNMLYYWNEKINHGFWGTEITNIVIQKASGEYFIFLANDDMITEHHFENYYNAIKDTRNDVVYFNSLLPGLKARISALRKNHIGHAELIIKTSFLKRMPAHKPVYGHDWILIKNMIKRGAICKKSFAAPTYYVLHVPSIEKIREYNPSLRRRLMKMLRKYFLPGKVANA